MIALFWITTLNGRKTKVKYYVKFKVVRQNIFYNGDTTKLYHFIQYRETVIALFWITTLKGRKTNFKC